MKIKFFKKEKKFKKERLHLSPNLFWRLSIFMIFIVAVSGSFFGYYLFSQINTESVISTSTGNSQVEKVSKERIDKVLEYFSSREQKSNEILNSSTPVVDPSF